MSDPGSHLSCYLAEWYRAEFWDEEKVDHTFAQLSRGAQVISQNGATAKVLMTLSVPTDDVFFCIFVAPSPDVVTQVCERAGIPAERVTAAMAIAAA